MDRGTVGRLAPGRRLFYTAAVASVMAPLPLLYATTKYLLAFPLDVLHYVLVQLCFLLSFFSWANAIATPHIAVEKKKESEEAEVKELEMPLERRKGENKRQQECDEMCEQLLQMISNDDSATCSSQWVEIFNEAQPYPLQVFQHKSRRNCFKINVICCRNVATTFDLVADSNRRLEWDDMCASVCLIEHINDTTQIEHVTMKAIWPTSTRDVLLLSHVRALSDGRLAHVTKSIEDARCPEVPGVIRIETGLAGQVAVPEGQDSKQCTLIRIVDGDLKGWVPKRVVSFIATQAVPKTMRDLNRLLATLPQRSKSKLLSDARSIPAVAKSAPMPMVVERSVQQSQRWKIWLLKIRTVLEAANPFMTVTVLLVVLLRVIGVRGNTFRKYLLGKVLRQ